MNENHNLKTKKASVVDIDALQQTNFEFDIEANRRRRAELANDVSELINISKFFLQHYSSDAPEDEAPKILQNNKVPIITKREKNEANNHKARERCNSRNVQAKKNAVAKATPTHVKRKQMRINNGTVRKLRGNDDDVPPLFDKIKLHQYCVDVVDRFFHGPPTNESEESESPKEEKQAVKKSQSFEKSVQTTNSGNDIGAVKTKRNSKYASVPSRYMNQTPQRSTNQMSTERNCSPFRLVSAKSREILEEVARKGTEIKRHSCLTHNRDKSIENRECGSPHKEVNRSQIRFRDIHPSIELVPSNTIFPKRILKQSSDSIEPSSADKKSNGHENPNNQIEIQSSVESAAKCNGNDPTESKSSSEIKVDHSAPLEVPPIKQLQFQQLPVLSIKPDIKCEIANIYEIEIKPNEVELEDTVPRDRNKVIELVYKPSAQESQQDEANSVVSNTSNRNQYNKLKNKYTAPFVNGEYSSEKVSDEKTTADDTQDSINIDSNLSTSHLTDDEKFRSDKKCGGVKASMDFKMESKTPAKSVIDKIFEVEGISEPSSNTQQNKVEIKPSAPSRSENFDDLREILRKIRSDRTTLDIALEATEPPDLMSPPRCVGDHQKQCNNLQKDEQQKHSVSKEDSTPKKPSPNKIISSQSSLLGINSSIVESPKFTKTIESIRSSARKLDFSSSEYRNATRAQIEKAAKKFLKSILKNADANVPQSASDRDDSSRISILKMEKQKFHIIDDQIIQSNFNIKSQHAESSCSSSSDATSFQLRMPSARLITEHSKKKCNHWSERTDSDFTGNSIEKLIIHHKLADKVAQAHQFSNGNYNCDLKYDELSDGEILSEGEFHIP